MISLFFLQTSWALWICYCACTTCWASHFCQPLSSPILITNRETKRQSPRCLVRPVFGGLTRIVLATEKSAGNTDSPVVCLYSSSSHKDANKRLSPGRAQQTNGEQKEREEGTNKSINLVWKLQQTDHTYSQIQWYLIRMCVCVCTLSLQGNE